MAVLTGVLLEGKSDTETDTLRRETVDTQQSALSEPQALRPAEAAFHKASQVASPATPPS